jgi:hypothetical protein
VLDLETFTTKLLRTRTLGFALNKCAVPLSIWEILGQLYLKVWNFDNSFGVKEVSLAANKEALSVLSYNITQFYENNRDLFLLFAYLLHNDILE